MKQCALLFLIVLSGTCFSQGYYSVSSKLFFEEGQAKDTARLENLNLKLLQASVFHATNLRRSKKRQFEYGKNLEKAATFHSEEMLKLGFFSHTNRKNRKYKNPSQRAEKFNAKYVVVGENILEEIAFNYKDNSLYDLEKEGGKFVFYHHNSGKKIRELTYKELAEKIVLSWMHSPDHKANILDKSYTHLGVGVAKVDNPYEKDELPIILITQLFGGN